MATAKTLEQTISVLLAASTFGDLQVRSLYMGPLLTSLKNYLSAKPCQKIDQIREAHISINRYLNGGQLNAAHKEFKKYFIYYRDLWDSPEYYNDTILFECLIAIDYAKKKLQQAQIANAQRLTSGPGSNAANGQAAVNELFDDVLDIAQQIASKYDLYAVDQKTMAAIMANSTQEVPRNV